MAAILSRGRWVNAYLWQIGGKSNGDGEHKVVLALSWGSNLVVALRVIENSSQGFGVETQVWGTATHNSCGKKHTGWLGAKLQYLRYCSFALPNLPLV